MRRSLRLDLTLLAAAALASAPARAAAEPKPAARFPIGLYDVNRMEALKELRRAGFDSFFTSVEDPQLDPMSREARRLGLRMLLFPRPRLQRSETSGWPVEAWYLHDEPENQRMPAATLMSIAAKTRAWDPSRLQAFSIGSGASAKTYASSADIVMLDWYPVPHLPLDSVADQIDRARSALAQDKPLWMIVQAMDWRDFPQKDASKPRVGRFPSAYEIRFMSYLSILHGASGIYFYTFLKPDGKTLLDYPDEWAALTKVVRELKSLQGVLERGRSAHLPFPPSPDGLEARAWRFRARDYVIVLNRKSNVLQRLPEQLLDPQWRPLFEAHRDPRDILRRIGDAWYLPPFKVLVFESGLRLGSPQRSW